MIRELTDMELDAVSGGGKHRHHKNNSSVTKSIKQSVDIDHTNVAVFNHDDVKQENEANVLLVAIIA